MVQEPKKEKIMKATEAVQTELTLNECKKLGGVRNEA